MQASRPECALPPFATGWVTDAGVPYDCRVARQQRWSYNGEQGCQPFAYGCGGNDNNFATQRACQRACGQLPPLSPVCYLPFDRGTACRANATAWAYSASWGACVLRSYAGCGGNANNFRTRDECEAACS